MPRYESMGGLLGRERSSGSWSWAVNVVSSDKPLLQHVMHRTAGFTGGQHELQELAALVCG